jgi:hypothetical protein
LKGFRTDANFTTGSGGNIILENCARASNVFFKVAGITIIGAAINFYGNVKS